MLFEYACRVLLFIILLFVIYHLSSIIKKFKKIQVTHQSVKHKKKLNVICVAFFVRQRPVRVISSRDIAHSS